MSDLVLTDVPELIVSSPTSRPGRLAHLTMADGLFAFIVGLAGVLRLTELAQIPLAPDEAQHALSTWAFWQPNALEISQQASPAYFSLSSVLMQLLGDGDGVMRLVPALFGMGIVCLPYFWRRYLGDWGALVTAVLLAFSPIQAIVARTAGGEAIAVFATLLLLTAWIRYQDERGQPDRDEAAMADEVAVAFERVDELPVEADPFAEREEEAVDVEVVPSAKKEEETAESLDVIGRSRWFYVGAGALGLGLVSSPLFYSGLVMLLLAWGLHRQLGPVWLHEVVARPDQAMLRSAGMTVGAVVFAVGTLFFWNPAGLAETASYIGEWLGQFSFSGAPLDWLNAVLLIGRYETIILLLAFIALVWATWTGQPIPTLFVYWFSVGLLVALLQHDTRENVALLILPAYFLIGLLVKRVMTGFELEPIPFVQWGLFATLSLLGATMYFNLARYARLAAVNPDDFANAWLAVVCFVFAIAIINFAFSWDRAGTTQAVVMTLLALFLVYQWGTAWWLSHDAANDPRARWVEVASDDDILTLTSTLREVSLQLTNSSDGLEIVAAVDSPVLRWYLRGYDNLQVGETVPAGATQTVIITPSTANPAFGTDYFGADLGLHRLGSLAPDISSDWSSVRWWLFHQTDSVMQIESIIVWVRSDSTLAP